MAQPSKYIASAAGSVPSSSIPGLNVSVSNLVHYGSDYVSLTVNFSGLASSYQDVSGPFFTPNYICFYPYLVPDTTGSGWGIVTPFYVNWDLPALTSSSAADFCRPVSSSGTKNLFFGPIPAGTTNIGIRASIFDGSYPKFSFNYILYNKGSVYGKNDPPTPTYPVISTKLKMGPSGYMLNWLYQDFSTVAMPPVPPTLTATLTASPTTVTVSPPNEYAVGGGPMGVTFDSSTNSVWTSNAYTSNVTKININTGATVGTYSVGSFPAGIVFDSNNNAIWVLTSSPNAVTKLNAANGASLGTYPLSAFSRGIAFDPIRNAIWIANTGSGSVTKLNAANGALIDTYAVGSFPQAVAFDSATNSVWVINGGSNNVTKLSAINGSLIGTYPTGSAPVNLTIDPINKTVWIANNSSNNLTKLNALNGSLLGTYPAPSPYGIVFDSATNSIWLANGAGGDGLLRKIDATTGLEILKIGLGASNALVVEDVTGSVWAPQWMYNNIRKVGKVMSFSSNPVLSWAASDPTAVCVPSASAEWSGNKPGVGSEYLNPLYTAGVHNYAITCYKGTSNAMAIASITAVANSAPLPPDILGPTSLDVGVLDTYTFTSTDPNGDKIRYGIDWNMDGTADEWVPGSTTYTDSGTSESAAHSWSVLGVKTFQALARDVNGSNSLWSNYNVTITTPTSPDLIVEGSVTPIVATAGTSASFSATVKNIGTASTGAGFSNFFQVATAINGGGTITDLTSTGMAALGAGASLPASSSAYTFPSLGSYSVRACADKTSSGNLGVITESDETNNCGTWTTITVAPANTVPTVINPTVSSITTTGATLGANVTSLGIPAAISARGTCVGTTPAPTTNCVAQGGTTSGIFTHARTGLASGTTYYYRGYATNTTGTGYSSDGTFTTSTPAPTFNFYSDDSSVPNSGTTVIRWNGVTNATSCTPSSGSSGWSGVSTSISGGSWTTGPLTIAGSPYTYALTCTGPGGSVPKGATVTVTVSATCNENGTCEAGENILTCPSDCKTKYQQF